MFIKFIIPVVPRPKKNNSQIITIKTKTGKFRNLIIPSKNYLKFEKECTPYILKVLQETNIIDYPVNVKCIFYVQKHLKYDLTNLLEAIDDTLVKAGLLLDDNRDIIASHDGSRVYFDKENPRIEIEIFSINEYEQWKSTKEIQKKLIE